MSASTFRRALPRITVVLALFAGMVVLPSSATAATPTVANGCVNSVPEPGTTTPVKICYTLFKPYGASRTRPVPMILHSHGWGGT